MDNLPAVLAPSSCLVVANRSNSDLKVVISSDVEGVEEAVEVRSGEIETTTVQFSHIDAIDVEPPDSRLVVYPVTRQKLVYYGGGYDDS